jgi:hypothetical protein
LLLSCRREVSSPFSGDGFEVLIWLSSSFATILRVVEFMAEERAKRERRSSSGRKMIPSSGFRGRNNRVSRFGGLSMEGSGPGRPNPEPSMSLYLNSSSDILYPTGFDAIETRVQTLSDHPVFAGPGGVGRNARKSTSLRTRETLVGRGVVG